LQEVIDDEEHETWPADAGAARDGDDMRRAGIMDAATHEKITLRHLGDRAVATAEPMTDS
jgi:hypothetical protein